ncbi:MAG: 6-phosphofructokinase [Bdellovibrionota bacterium]|jgi:phosphofructokinase-like protein
MTKRRIGVLTAGGDCPGLNAAMRGIGKACIGSFQMDVIGFRDGFKGLAEDRVTDLSGDVLSGILTIGGTILGTSRDKPKKVFVDGKTVDMTEVIVNNYRKHALDALVCIGGGGTQKNAYQLVEEGLNIITLPKTIDNDVVETDVTFGFDTALGIATEAIDRLHSTADSHHRIIVVEVMGHKAGWLALGAGIAGGADVILLPEIPYHVEVVAEAISWRRKQGKTFSIVAIAEGALSQEELANKRDYSDEKGRNDLFAASHALALSKQLEQLTGLESRVTILGHLQRGGAPSAGDRLLATRLGTACAEFIAEDRYGIMVAAKGAGVEAVPLEKVAGKRKTVPLDHPWIKSAKHVGTCFGDS